MKFKRILSFVLVAVMLVGLLPQTAVHVHAASSTGTGTLSDPSIGVSYEKSTDYSFANQMDSYAKISASGNAIEASGKSRQGAGSNRYYAVEITLTNNLGAEATLSFDYTVSLTGAGYVQVDGVNVTTNGSFSKKLANGASVTIVVNSGAEEKNQTTTIVMSNITLASDAKSTVTFGVPANGSYTVDGVSVTETKPIENTVTHVYSLKATPAEGYTFVGWYVAEDGQYISADATAEMKFSKDCTVYPVFRKNGSNFKVGEVIFDTLSGAVEYAKVVNINQIVQMEDYVLTENVTIPTGITLLIPYDAAETAHGTTPKYVTETETPSVYRKLTLGAGVTLTVNGNIEVGGRHYTSTTQYVCKPTGAYGQIILSQNSEIVLNSGANLYAWGYITGSGKVTANPGANVSEIFQITDWRGGTATGAMNSENNPKVFMVSQYYVQNIESELTIFTGAKLTAYCTVSANMGITVLRQTCKVVLAGEDGLFTLGEDSFFTKKYTPATDRIEYRVGGRVEMNSITLKVSTTSVDSSKYVLPISNNVDIVVAEDGSVLIGSDVALLPGSTVTIEENAMVELDEDCSLYVYDVEQWSKTYVYNGSNNGYIPVAYSPSGRGNRATLTDAKIDINGELYVYGSIYTTSSGASIISSEGTGIFYMTGLPGTATVTHQAIQSGSSITYADIAINPAWLQNKDGSYVKTGEYGEDTTFYYSTIDGKWSTCAHKNAELTGEKKADCGNDGYTGDAYCPDCGQNLVGTIIPATGDHQWKDATCTEPPVCGVCGAQKPDSAAKGHNYIVSYLWNGDQCTATGVCGCNDTVTATVTGSNKQVKTPGTCQIRESYTLTAVFSESWAGTDECYFTGELDPSNHAKGLSETWNSDGTQHWHSYICCGVAGEKSEHAFTNEVRNVDYRKEEATCEHGNIYYKSCDCGAKGTETFDDGNKKDHSYGDVTYTWNQSHNVCTATRQCDCGDKQTADARFIWCEWDGEHNCLTDGYVVFYAKFVDVDWAETCKSERVPNGKDSDTHVGDLKYMDDDNGKTHHSYYDGCNHTVEENLEHAYTNGVCICGAKLTGLGTDGKLYVDGTLVNGIHQNGDKIYVYKNGEIETDANGMYENVDGAKYWIVNGEAQTNEGVVVETGDGGKLYYYFGEDGKAITNQKDYHIDKAIGNLPAANYNFNEDGTIEHDEDTTKCGIAEADCGGLYYFINGIKIGKGLFEQDGYYYYARTSTGEIICGRSYYVFLTNGLPIKEGYYKFDEQGRMILSGIIEDGNGNCYYRDENGKMVTGLVAVGDDYYYFDKKSGKMYTNIELWVNDVKDDKGNVILQGGYYKFGEDGKMITTCFMTVGEYTYYMEDGVVALGERYIDGYFYLFNRGNGRMYKNVSGMWFNEVKDDKGNVILESGFYNIDSEGRVIFDNGFVTVGDYTYYMENGVYAKGERYIDGYFYLFNRGDGKMYKGIEAMWFNEVKDDEGNVILEAGFYDIDGDGKAILN